MMSFSKYEKYKDSGLEWLGEIPEKWEVKRLKDIANLKSGEGITSDLINELGEYPVYGGNGLRGYCSTFTHDGDYVLIGRQGALCGNINYAFGKFWASEHAVVVTLLGKHKTIWFGELLRVLNLNQYSLSAAQPGLAVERIKILSIPVPPIEEQTSIANYVDKKAAQIDKKVELLQTKKEQYQELRKAFIIEALTRGIDNNVELKDSGVEWLGKIPKHWEVKRVKDLFNLITDIAPNDNDYQLLSIYTSIGVKPRADLEQRGNKSVTTDGYWIVKKGDFIVNKLLAWMGAIALSGYDGVTSPAYDILRKKTPLILKYYEYLFRTEAAQAEFKRNSRGIMEVRLRLYFDKFGAISVPVQSLKEQQQIVDYLDEKTQGIDAILAKIDENIVALNEFRKTLINDAVTGKIKVV
jgi:type I restriction enzyme S subunit